MNQSSKRIAFGLVLALVLLVIFSLFTKEYRSEPEIAFSDFLGSVERGDIEAVVIQGHYVHGSYKNGAGFKTFAPDDPELVKSLRRTNVKIAAKPEDESPWYMVLLLNCTRVINRVMRDGKKQIAERLVYTGMQKAADKLKVENPLEVFEQAFKNIQPHMETRSRRVGGANYQIPFEVKGQRQSHLTIMWFVAATRSRKGMSMADRIALELVEAYNNQGAAVKKKEDTHKMAEANRAFAHFARG